MFLDVDEKGKKVVEESWRCSLYSKSLNTAKGIRVAWVVVPVATVRRMLALQSCPSAI